MEEFADIRYESSEQHVDQHKEITTARTSRDHIDAQKNAKLLGVEKSI